MLPRASSSDDSTTPLLAESEDVSFYLQPDQQTPAGADVPSSSSATNLSSRLVSFRRRLSRNVSVDEDDDHEHHFLPAVKSQSKLSALEEVDENGVPSSSSSPQRDGDAVPQGPFRATTVSAPHTSVPWKASTGSRRGSAVSLEGDSDSSRPASRLERGGSRSPVAASRNDSSTNLRRGSLARKLSAVSEFVGAAAEVAAQSKKSGRNPNLGDFFRSKQISIDLNGLSFESLSSNGGSGNDKQNLDVEHLVTQKIKEAFQQSLFEYYAQEMAERQEYRGGLHAAWSLVSKSFGKFGFWIIVSVLAVLTFKDVVDLVIDYSSDPKQSDMNIMFNESMTMPNITFCMSRSQAWSHFAINPNETTEEWDEFVQNALANMTTHDAFLNNPWDYRLVMEAYEVIGTLNSMERETTPHGAVRSIHVYQSQARLAGKRVMVKMWMGVLADRNVTFEEFTQKVGSETIRRSMQRFQRTTYDENLVLRTHFRVSWISMMQFCFQPWFDGDNFPPIKDQGNFFIMMLSHNPEKLAGKQVECMSVDFHGRPSSLSRFMEGKGRTRDGFNDELCPGMVHEVTVEVRARYVMLENEEPGIACNDLEEGEDTEFDCRSRCRMHMLREVCNCTAPTLSYLASKEELTQYPICDYSKCMVDVQKANYTDEKCSSKCYRDCNQIRYEIDHETKGRSVRSDLTSVHLNWGSFEFLTLEQQRIWSVTTFIAALGGSFGMWLGLSILSILQGASYVFHLIRESQKRRTKAKAVVTDNNNNTSNGIAANPFASPFKSKPPPNYEESQRENSVAPIPNSTNIQVE